VVAVAVRLSVVGEAGVQVELVVAKLELVVAKLQLVVALVELAAAAVVDAAAAVVDAARVVLVVEPAAPLVVVCELLEQVQV
jgi:hypothetical protein